MNPPIRLLIVDDHPLARQGVVAMLSAFDDRFQIVGEAASIDEALIRAKSARPEIVLTDLHFGPGESRNGLDLVALLSQRQPDLQFVMITSEVSDQFLLKAHDAGINAFLHKHASAAEIVRAIESVASGFTHFPSQLKAAVDKRKLEPRLTPREEELLPFIARGLTAKQIARELSHPDAKCSVEDRTIEVHKGNIKRKCRLDSANSLITFAIEYCQDRRIDYRVMAVQVKRTAP